MGLLDYYAEPKSTDMINSINVEVNNHMVSLNINVNKLSDVVDFTTNPEQLSKILGFVLSKNIQLVPNFLIDVIIECKRFNDITQKLGKELRNNEDFFESYRNDSFIIDTALGENDLTSIKMDLLSVEDKETGKTIITEFKLEDLDEFD